MWHTDAFTDKEELFWNITIKGRLVCSVKQWQILKEVAMDSSRVQTLLQANRHKHNQETCRWEPVGDSFEM